MILGIGFIVGRTAAAPAPSATILRGRSRRGAVLIFVAGGVIVVLALAIVLHGAAAALEGNQFRFGQNMILTQHGLQMINIVDGDAVKVQSI